MTQSESRSRSHGDVRLTTLRTASGSESGQSPSHAGQAARAAVRRARFLEVKDRRSDCRGSRERGIAAARRVRRRAGAADTL